MKEFPKFPKQCLHWRGSYGVGKDGAMVPSATRPWYAVAHFWWYLQYLVHVTFASLQRIGPFFHFRQKNRMVSAWNAFQDCPKALETQMASGSLLRASRELPESFLRVSQGIWVDILTKSEQNQTFSQTGHVQKFRNVNLSEKKAPAGGFLT